MAKRIGFLVLGFMHIIASSIVVTTGISLKSDGLCMAGGIWVFLGLVSLLWSWLTWNVKS